MQETTYTKFDQLIERITFPVHTRDIIEFARVHGTGDDVVTLANRLAPQMWGGPHEVRAVLKEEI